MGISQREDCDSLWRIGGPAAVKYYLGNYNDLIVYFAEHEDGWT